MTRRLRIGAIALAGLVLIIALAGLGGLAWLRGEGGRSWTAAQIEQAVADETGLALKVGRLEGDLLERIVLQDVVLADRDGVWLTMERARIEWAPAALTGGLLHIKALTALALEITRAPLLPEAPSEPDDDGPASDGAPSLPIDVALDQLSIQPITIGEALVGEAAVLKVDGRLTAREGDLLEAEVSVIRHDGPGGTLAGTLAYRLAERQFQADLKLSEPSGALLREITGLEAAGATEVALKAGGGFADVRGTLEASVAGLGSAKSDLELALGEALRITARGRVQSLWQPDGVPSGLWDGDIRFDVAAERAEDGRLSAERLDLENRIVAVRAQGALEPEGDAITATAEIELRDLSAVNAAIAPLEIDAPNLAVAVDGTLAEPRLEVDTSVSRLSAPGLQAADTSLQLTLAPRLEEDALAFSGSGRIAGLTIDGTAELAALLSPALTWQADGRLDLANEAVALSQLRVEGERLSLTGSGDVDFTPGLALETTIELPDMAALQDLIGLPLSGGLAMSANLRAADIGAGLDAELDGRLEGFSLGDATLDTLVGAAPAFAADLRLPGYQTVGLSDFSATLRAGELTGDLDLDLPNAELSGALRFSTDDLAPLSDLVGESLAGSGRLEATLSGPTGDPQAEGRLNLRKATFGPLVRSDLTADFTVQRLVSGPEGQVDAKLSTDEVRLEAASGFALDEADLRLTGLSLRGDGVSAAGDLRVPLAGPPVAGRIGLDVSDLDPSLSLIALDGAGSGRAELELDGDGPRQTLTITGAFEGLRLALAEEDTLSVRTARLSARSNDLLAGGLADLSLELTTVTAGGVTLDGLALTGSGDLEAARFGLVTRGELALEAAGELSTDGPSTGLTLERLDGEVLGETLGLSGPARFGFGDEAVRVEGLSLGFGGARISLEADVSKRDAEVSLEATEVPLRLARLAAPDLSLGGTASLEVRVTGPSRNPQSTITFAARDVDLSETLDSPPLQIDADGRLAGGRLSLSARLTGFAQDAALVELALPLELAVMPFSAALREDAPLTGSVAWRGQLAELWALVPLDGHRASGPAAIDLSLAGTPARPRAEGRVTLERGEYENFEAGTLLQDLAVILDLRGDRLVVETLSASDGGNGRLTGTGRVDLVPERGFPFSFETDFVGFTLVRRDEVTAASDGNLTVDGSLSAIEVAGSFETTEVEIRIPDSLPPTVVDLEVTEQGGGRSRGQIAASAPAPEGESDVDIELSVTMPARVFVRGRGLETEWKGWLRITGSAAAPAIEGELENLRGRLRVVGKDFDLQQSKISFAGTSDLAPLLDIRAVNETDDLRVTVTVTGTPDQPTITLASSPSLPQEEILARILFGKSTAQLSALEAVQLAASVAELSGSGLGGAGVLDFTRDLIGVDVLNVGTSDGVEGGAEVSAGKYLTDNVYVGVKQGTTPGSSEVEVEVELTPNISVGSDVGATGESNIGVQFKLDY